MEFLVRLPCHIHRTFPIPKHHINLVWPNHPLPILRASTLKFLSPLAPLLLILRCELHNLPGLSLMIALFCQNPPNRARWDLWVDLFANVMKFHAAIPFSKEFHAPLHLRCDNWFASGASTSFDRASFAILFDDVVSSSRLDVMETRSLGIGRTSKYRANKLVGFVGWNKRLFTHRENHIIL